MMFEWNESTILLASTLIKIVLLVVVFLQIVPIMVWVERRGSALMQNRLGPNRVGPLGLIQSAADAIKLIFKEDVVPDHAVNKFYFFLAPIVSVIPAFMTFAVIPFGSSVVIQGVEIPLQVTSLDIGFLYVFAIASIGVYGIIMSGWASNSKYALLGSVRSTAQMISYELTLALSVIGIVLTYSSLDLMTIATKQSEVLMQLGPLSIPKWGIFVQPLGFLLFITAAYAETNRLPFDLPEGESEIVAGYHLEYGSMKFAIFMMAEYLNMTTASGLLTTLFFGGWQLLPGMSFLLDVLTSMQFCDPQWIRVALEVASFSIKTLFFLWLFVWVRWTLPRFRFDQLMNFGWKVLLPLSLLNIVVTAGLIVLGVI